MGKKKKKQKRNQKPTTKPTQKQPLVLEHKEQRNVTIWGAGSSMWELVHPPTMTELCDPAGSHIPAAVADTVADAAMLMLCP